MRVASSSVWRQREKKNADPVSVTAVYCTCCWCWCCWCRYVQRWGLHGRKHTSNQQSTTGRKPRHPFPSTTTGYCITPILPVMFITPDGQATPCNAVVPAQRTVCCLHVASDLQRETDGGLHMPLLPAPCTPRGRNTCAEKREVC